MSNEAMRIAQMIVASCYYVQEALLGKENKFESMML